mmetsp:Transcript_14434/g.50221  ORF Transcript_14434/g.50221 Transcript_14434/m.50221 type:complete len:237 (+) Transcript_14434:1376-2086(+)
MRRASRGESPDDVGKLLRIELRRRRHSLVPHRLEEQGRFNAGLCKTPGDVCELLRLEAVDVLRDRDSDGLKQVGVHDAGRRIGPGHVRQRLRAERVDLAARIQRDGVVELRGLDGRRRIGPGDVGKFLGIELVQFRRHHFRDGVEEREPRSEAADLGDSPEAVDQTDSVQTVDAIRRQMDQLLQPRVVLVDFHLLAQGGDAVQRGRDVDAVKVAAPVREDSQNVVGRAAFDGQHLI